MDTVCLEIGSTITKATAFSGITDAKSGPPRVLGQGVALTSVDEGDVTFGVDRAMANLSETCPINAGNVYMLAASSAAGGLKMSVHGLTRDMTLRAAREASLGAGAVVVYTTAGAMTESDLEELREKRPKLVLLSGGVDYGDRDIVIANARLLARARIPVPIIYAGNVSARREVSRIFSDAGIEYFVCENVYPKIDELNVRPVRKLIQEVFARHIVSAPGMDRIKEMVSGDIMPTPGAVLAAAELLYDTLGDLVVVDVGGATTDIHSVTEGQPKHNRLMAAPEPLAKRTVEGDLGVFINADSIVEESGGAVDEGEVAPLPTERNERDRSIQLTRWAVDLAMWRHAGEIRTAFGASGKSELVEGRDLTAVRYLIGTGGALTRLGAGRDILSNLRRDPSGRKLLPPPDVKVFIDDRYVMASAGLLAAARPEAAQSIMLESLSINSTGGGVVA
ncbi:MAG: glutamate mutase L [Deltaproteobacteria bacterium]|nr:glutamate mutase L [Candidatus Zymogenaceae bacterium]